MKTFTIYDALEFLTLAGYYTNEIEQIGYTHMEINKCDFLVFFIGGEKIYLNLDEETIKKD